MRDLAEARNDGRAVVFSTEKSLKEHEVQLDEETRSDIRAKIDAAKQALEGDDAADIRAKLEALREASFKLGEMVYQQAQAQAQPQGGEAPADEEPAERGDRRRRGCRQEAGDRA